MTEQKKESIKKFANESPCICFNLRKASRAITKIYDGMFRKAGLSAVQAAILNSIRMLGSMTVTQLAEAMATDRTTITRNLSALERDGYIKIIPGQDRRARIIVITKKGNDTSSKTMAIWTRFQKKIYKMAGKTRLEKLCKDISGVLLDIEKG